MIQTLKIPFLIPSFNEHDKKSRTHWSAGASHKKIIENKIMFYINKANLKKIKGGIFIFHWMEPNRMRDKDNISFGKKFIFDSLVRMKIIQNDGWDNVIDMYDIFSVSDDKKDVGCIVDIISDDFDGEE